MGDMGREGPEFSVLIAAHDAATTIGETLDSLLAQTEPNWQACVVDDGSSDETYEIVRRYAREDRRFVVSHQRNSGSGAARNAAACMATADYLCILDSDDVYKPTYLERQRAFMRAHPGFDIYSCNADAVMESGVTQPYAPERYPREACSLVIKDVIKMNRIFVAAVVKASTFRGVAGFREDVYVEDYDLWLRLLARRATHIHNPESLVRYRIRSDAKSADSQAALESMLEVYRDLLAD